MGTVALIVSNNGSAGALELLEVLSDDREIGVFESAVESGGVDPLKSVHLFREQQSKEDEEFGNYIEELLSQPFVRSEIQEHGVKWLKSKIRIEHFQRKEQEAARVIAEYAFKIYQENPNKTDFFLSGPTTAVRIRIFTLQREKMAA